MKLNPANSTDEIILAMLNKRGTFLEMFEATGGLIKKGSNVKKSNASAYNLNEEDELLIPAIKFKALREYTEVRGLEFSSKYGAIGRLAQAISFNFDRKGVVLQAGASAVDSTGMPQKPKLLHFDKPFYLYIREANAPHPYFNVWVSDADILERKKLVKSR